KRGSSLGFSAQSAVADERESMKARVMEHLKNAFRPEFINRVDEIIVFDRLTDEDIRVIASKMLKKVAERIDDLGVRVEFDGSAVSYLAKEGTYPVYGARPLKRVIMSKVEDSFATALLEGAFVKGDAVTVSADENGLIWNKADSVPSPVEESASADGEDKKDDSVSAADESDAVDEGGDTL
ncbi:MAG: hypothetical protein IJY04_00050, partial [Clostridia bacterium]|nr:hypothetical protein [Clostridia bacterium]